MTLTNQPAGVCGTLYIRSLFSGGFFLVSRVSAELAGRGELPELVSDHVFGNKHTDELVSIVHLEIMPDELGDDGARAGPGLDHRFGFSFVQGVDLQVQLFVHVRAFFAASAHGIGLS